MEGQSMDMRSPGGAPNGAAAALPVRMTKLVVQGFKSFQRRTAVPLFTGFNAIIGPNGAGKSNILDAICFVLGRSSRGLRAGRLDQIIYNGAAGSKPAEYAFVEITLDNSTGKIPGQPAEVTVSRKVNRQGVSVYKINDKIVTRELVLDVLRAAAIDPDGHNITQQGDITMIIETKPEERRAVLDEIASVREYLEKKDKAVKELDAAQQKINEGTLVLKQKEDFLRKIEKERDLALKHQALQKEHETLRATLAFSKLSAVESALQNVSNALDVKEQEFSTLREKVDAFDKELEDKEREVRQLDNQILQKSVNAALRREIEDINTRMLRAQGQINADERELLRLNELIDRLRAMRGRREEPGQLNAAVRAVLGLKKAGVFGTVGQLCRYDSKYQAAIEVAAGGHLADVIVDTEQAAIECIDYLKQQNLGRVRFLPLDRIQPRPISAKADIASKQAGVIGFAVRLVQFDKKYEAAYNYVFGETLVAENIEAARKIKGTRTVTLDGELFEAGGAIVGGKLRLQGGKQEKQEEPDIAQYEEARARLETEIRALQGQVAELEKQLEEKRALESQEGADVKGLEAQREKLVENLDMMRRQRREQYERRILLETEVQSSRLQKARLEAELEGLRVDFEQYKALAESGSLKRDDPDRLEREIRRVERQIQQIGLINMKAIEEYEIFKKDYEEQKAKIEQLYAERNSINAMIEKLETRRREIFFETLNAITQEFSAVFADLVGGNAVLELEDEADIESGLLIKAQPKGKPLVNIDALSGGEKTLTALAFLFAVMRHKAAPFYLLDEIDAALDKANSEKIGYLIQKFAASSQFIVITHNDITARRAERIYGVSMQNGISQVLGVKL